MRYLKKTAVLAALAVGTIFASGCSGALDPGTGTLPVQPEHEQAETDYTYVSPAGFEGEIETKELDEGFISSVIDEDTFNSRTQAVSGQINTVARAAQAVKGSFQAAKEAVAAAAAKIAGTMHAPEDYGTLEQEMEGEHEQAEEEVNAKGEDPEFTSQLQGIKQDLHSGE